VKDEHFLPAVEQVMRTRKFPTFPLPAEILEGVKSQEFLDAVNEFFPPLPPNNPNAHKGFAKLNAHAFGTKLLEKAKEKDEKKP
jgi:hypothetical protein